MADSGYDGSTLAHCAAAKGQLACLKWMCSSTLSNYVEASEPNSNGVTPLYFAAQGSFVSTRQLLT